LAVTGVFFDDPIDVGAGKSLFVENATHYDRLGESLGRVIARPCHAIELIPEPEGVDDLGGTWQK
jgi:hypothetical protein